MTLTVREAATLTGRSERTIRAQLKRGALKGVKRAGHWLLPRSALPLDAGRRRALARKADDLRDAVETALPESVKQRGIQLNDSATFRPS